MKKLSKITLHDVKDAMNDVEMKRILGGAYASEWCASGERLFHCVADLTGYGDPQTTFDAGSICAKDSHEANKKAIKTFKQQEVDGHVAVSCT